ncbi:MAG: polyphosphate kinase 1 [Methanoregulaceae archaeon]|nr:polyphosphate kinase 1 [Methanoregulaceae archaeon]
MACNPPPAERTRETGRCDLLENPENFINRELSWLEFNGRVLEEACDPSQPLLERVKYIAIFANNLDEFFMIRVSGLQRQAASGVRDVPPDGMSPSRQLDAIHRTLAPMLADLSEAWHHAIVPALAQEGIRIRCWSDLPPATQETLRDYFTREIFPVLTPLTFDTSHPFPFISNLSLNLAVLVHDPVTRRESFARLKVPSGLFPRIVPVPGPVPENGERALLFLEDLVAANLDLLFPGLEVVASYPFRITRDADLEIEEDEASDLLTAIEESVEQRRVGRPCRIEVTPDMPEQFLLLLGMKLGIHPALFYRVPGPVGMADLMALRDLDRPVLKDTPFVPFVPAGLAGGPEIFTAIRQQDQLLYHPYDSFAPVVAFLREAARDPDVLAIKATLYRVGRDSPIVEALREAREQGKAVAVLVELKARFDEENNIGWARALEHAGVHVVYGVVGLKVHAKVCMVVRREKGGVGRYIHMGTGNYNAVTSRVYTDLGMFTADPVIGADVADLFNTLTGGSRVCEYRKLLVAPRDIRNGIIRRIDREIEHHRLSGDGYLMFKMNALADRECIMALYRASQAGVRVVLQVRGICCLRPGIPGLSDTIRVTSIVGRFLEHARIFYFHNGGKPEIFLGSADLMPRNLDRRVEVLFPVDDAALRSALIDTVIPVQLSDTEKTRVLLPRGTYRRFERTPEIPAVNAQAWFMEHSGCWHHRM